MTNKQSAFSIAGRAIADDQPPFIVAEFSGNHSHDFCIIEKMIQAAATSGADAIKLQTYTADTITLNSNTVDFQINEESSLWRGETLYSLYQKAHTPWEWHAQVFKMAQDYGLIAFSSPFDESSVDFLESLNVPCYKIASFELNHFPLLRKVAQTGKPIIMSTGMATLDEISEAVEYLYKNGCSQLALMKCTSSYPAPVSDANLRTIDDMKARFQVPVGLSDHSKGIGVSLLAVGLGANLIERHFVLDQAAGAIDGDFSSTPEELAFLVRESQQLRLALGSISYGPSGSEEESMKYRRSIYVCRSLTAGQTITANDIKVVRPGFGMAPKHYDEVIGRTLKMAKEANTPLHASDLN